MTPPQQNGATARVICGRCRHRTPIPGDCHISCGAAFSAEDNPLAGVIALFASVGRGTYPETTKAVSFHPVIVRWPGSGAWPAAFDEGIVRECSGYEATS